MKIICSKQELVKSINIVQKAVPSKTTMSILQCILIDATAGEIKFTGNDTELGIETIVTGEIVERGMVALDARIFSDLVRKLPDQDVSIECDSNLQTTIICGKAKFQIMGRDGEDFTAVPLIARNQPVVISQFALKEIIRQTLFSIAQNDTNKIMTGELFEIRDGKLRVVSLDGHRISIRSLELKESSEDVKVIVPGKTLAEISRILSGGAEDMVNVYFTKNHIMFVFDQTVVVSRLIEGNYFRVDQMITNDYETKVTINRQDMLECIDRSILLVREDDKKPIILTIAEGEMEIQINSQIGSMDEKIAVQMEGKEIRIGFNPKYLIDALKVIDDEEIDIYYVNPKAPCFIRDQEQSYIYLVLPVNFVS